MGWKREDTIKYEDGNALCSIGVEKRIWSCIIQPGQHSQLCVNQQEISRCSKTTADFIWLKSKGDLYAFLIFLPYIFSPFLFWRRYSVVVRGEQDDENFIFQSKEGTWMGGCCDTLFCETSILGMLVCFCWNAVVCPRGGSALLRRFHPSLCPAFGLVLIFAPSLYHL